MRSAPLPCPQTCRRLYAVSPERREHPDTSLQRRCSSLWAWPWSRPWRPDHRLQPHVTTTPEINQRSTSSGTPAPGTKNKKNKINTCSEEAESESQRPGLVSEDVHTLCIDVAKETSQWHHWSSEQKGNEFMDCSVQSNHSFVFHYQHLIKLLWKCILIPQEPY